MLGKYTPAYKALQSNVRGLVEGITIGIDPSIGSSSSMPGYSVYRAGNLIDSGIFQLNPEGTKPERLQHLHFCLRRLYNMYSPDVLVYEEIPSQRYGGGGNANAHASLLNAVGVILSVSGPDTYVGLTPQSWKKMARPEYTKSDVNDAVELGWIAINLARDLSVVRSKKRGKN